VVGMVRVYKEKEHCDMRRMAGRLSMWVDRQGCCASRANPAICKVTLVVVQRIIDNGVVPGDDST
jgi:hypothetical protein